MEKLDQILESFVAEKGEKAGRDKLLGAAFVVVNKDGEGHINLSTVSWEHVD